MTSVSEHLAAISSPGQRGMPPGSRMTVRMTPGARIAAAIDILAAIEPASGRPTTSPPIISAAAAISAPRTGRRSPAYVYAVLRHRAVLDWWIARASKDEIAPDARSRVIAALLLIDEWPPDEVAASFDGGRFRPAALVAGRAAAGAALSPAAA